MSAHVASARVWSSAARALRRRAARGGRRLGSGAGHHARSGDQRQSGARLRSRRYPGTLADRLGEPDARRRRGAVQARRAARRAHVRAARAPRHVSPKRRRRALESTDVFLRSSGVYRGQTVRVGYSADIARERILGVEFLETLPTRSSTIRAPSRRARSASTSCARASASRRTSRSQLNSRGTFRLDGRLVDVDYESGATAGRTDFLDRELGGEYRRAARDQRGTLGVRVFATGYEAALNNNTTDTRGARAQLLARRDRALVVERLRRHAALRTSR